MTTTIGIMAQCLWILYTILPGIFSLEASFYGESYIWLPREDASSTTDLQLEFRTSRPDTLLFLAGGSPDYLLVRLEGGAIRVVMDLGSGETELGSHPGLVFNDLHWHYIHLYRTGLNIQLNINNMSTISTNSPGRFTELNINRGLFLGAVAASSDLFYGILREYRGCLQNVFFNGMDVLYAAHTERDPLHVYEVNWECSAEFGASSHQPLSFLQNTSFVAFRQLESYKQGRFTFDFKTRSDTALILYGSGRFSNPDFIAAELIGGVAHLTVNKGSGIVKFASGGRVNDAMWHQVEIVINPMTVALSIDGHREERQMNFGESRYLDLYGYMYLGGVGIIARSTATQHHLNSLSGANQAAGSFIGCVQNFKVNGELFGFREAEVTKELLPECVWNYPCTSEPCIAGAQCEEDGFYYYNCLCETSSCYKQGPTAQNPSPTEPHEAVIHVQTLVIQEGGTSLILRNNLDLVGDYHEYGIRDSAAVFRVVERPEHGSLQVELSEHESGATVFTFRDIMDNLVSFVHDGSESEMDSIGLELEFVIPDDIMDADMPDVFKEKYGLTLMINIMPWNDKPDIRLPKDNTLVLVNNTQVVITPKIIRAMDRDDPPGHLEYTVHYQHGVDVHAYFEKDLVARIDTFTQEDINEGRVIFTHRGVANQQIRIQVSDRKDVSDPQTLHVHAVPLQIIPEANTGLYVPKGSNNLILKQNLSYTTNTLNQDFPIRYEITVPPFDGEVQRQQPSNNQWVVSSSFTQLDIDSSRIRYFHYNEPNLDDFFKYRVYVMSSSENPMQYDFEISIVQTGVNLTTNRGLMLHGMRDGYITNQVLHAISTIPYHTPDDVVISVLTLPAYGQLFRIHQRTADRIRKKRIYTNFTQADINAGNILYRLNKALLEPIEDSFTFRIEIPGAQSRVATFSIHYSPLDSEVSSINNGLSNVREGGQKMLTRDDLFMQSDNIYDFTYTVIDAPEYGVLQLVNPKTGTTVIRNATSFTNRDILNERVYYVHDDSENMDDFFSFTATPNIHHTQGSQSLVQEIDEFSGTFEIKIMPLNDNSPERLIEKPFQVVANRGRVLTLDDIKYADPDVDFDDDDLMYAFRQITNGEFVRSEDHSIGYSEFTQRDIADGKVYFRHFGVDKTEGSVYVSDGDYKTIGKFEVLVSEPYINIHNNTGLAVHKGETITITTVNISIDSNMDAQDKEFKFIITQLPSHGIIKKNTNERNRFHLGDLKKGNVQYQHDNTEFLDDEFGFTVRCDNTEVSGTVQVKILLGDHQHQLSVVHNRMTPVEELETVIITKQELRIGHPDSQPVSIRYTVTRNPQFGVITLRGKSENDGSMQNIRRFTQKDVNDNKLMYTHTAAGQTTDAFRFDVSNGALTLQQQEFVLEVIPALIPLKVDGFAIPEGGFKSISSTNIKIKNRYFQKQDLEYSIVKKPRHGRITYTDNHDVEVVQFNHNQVQRRKIIYIHDDSDTTSDNITLFVRIPDSKYRSDPQTILITIIPKNDEPPILTVNQPLHLWIGAAAAITPENLRVDDKDTRPDRIMYIIGNPINGEVTLKDHPTRNVVNFTQEHINQGQVIFRQRVDAASSFEFRATDGESYTEHAAFVIEAIPLVLSLEKLIPLEAYPNVLQPITANNLKAVTNDVDNQEARPIYYTLQSKPHNGQLVMVLNGSEAEITTFSQNDIDNMRVFYHHTSSMVGWTQDDSFTFEVSTLYAARISYKSFQIHVSYEFINEYNRDQLIRVAPPTVREGETVVLTKDNLDISKLRRRLTSSGVSGPEISLVITRLPQHGKLMLNSSEVMLNDYLLQKDINKQHVSYVHDDSDSFWDAFHFSLDIETPGIVTGEDSDFNTIFNITIDPKNDQQFELITEDPKIYVVQGFMANISKVVLNTIDPDTIPSQILYKVATDPSHGLLVNTDDMEMSIGDFSQQDINDNKIKYLNDGSRSNDAFYFQVNDGRYPPLYKVFTIHVRPLTLELRSIKTVHLEQGLFSQYLTEETFNVTTNGKISNIRYNITRPPKNGQLYLNNAPVRHFSHLDVMRQDITYIQTDASKSTDEFKFSVYDTLNNISGRTVHIRVLAALKTSDVPPEVEAGKALTLTLDMLDASHLANITQSNPVYSVTAGPRLGRLYQVSRNKRAARARGNAYDDDEPAEYFRFTHEDIKDGVVQYEPEESSVTAGPETDSFSFILKAKAAQPAHGSFEVTVQPSRAARTTPKISIVATKPPPKPTEKPKDGMSTSTKKGNTDHLMIVYIVSAITVAVIVLIITIKCVKHKKKKKLQRLAAAMKEDSKTPLSTQPVINADPDLYNKQYGRPYDPRIPTINITPDSEAGSLGSRASSRQQKAAPAAVYPDYRGQRPETRSPPQDPASRAVPTCKVTPLADGEGDQGDKADQVPFDWENMDPELLQHCRTTNPVLHDSKYWV